MHPAGPPLFVLARESTLDLVPVLGRMQHFSEFWRHQGLADVPELATDTYDRHAAYEAMSRYLSTTPPSRRFDVVMCDRWSSARRRTRR